MRDSSKIDLDGRKPAWKGDGLETVFWTSALRGLAFGVDEFIISAP